jgi:hypothetical protein
MPVHESSLQDKGSLDTESCWALLERVVASPQLSRAARMREFLLYVGRRSLKEGCDQIPEQEIGSAVFGRPPSYDTNADNIVRVNATDLRKRVEAYFEADGAQETVILDIPRGSYKPVFHYRSTPPQSVEPGIEPSILPTAPATGVSAAALPDLHPASPRGSHRRPLVLSGLLIAALAVACGVLLVQNHAMRRSLYAWRSTPAVNSFWSEILNARPNTDVILADTSFALIEDITKKSIPLNDYLSRSYITQLQSQDLSQDRRDDLMMIGQRNNGSLGDFHAAQRIMGLDPFTNKMHLYDARDYMPTLLRQDNVVLIGARKSNPWEDLFVGSLNFTVEYDPDRHVNYVKNHAQASGEQAIYTSAPASEPNSGYSVVAYLPNPDQGGKVLILAGTDSQATEGAGEFLTSEDSLKNFKNQLHVSTLPYFEVLLKTTHLNGTPMDAKIVAYRTYPSKN